MLRNFLTILRREFSQLGYTAAIYCVLSALTLVYSLIYYSSVDQSRQALIQPVSFMVGILSMFLVPVLTMRSFAGEENSGTIETLLTLPIRRIEIVLGKFFGCWLFYSLTLLPLAGYLLIFWRYGEIDWGVVIATVLGLLMIGAAQVSAGLFVSSLTSNIIVAAAGGCIVNVFVFMLSMPIETGGGVYSFPAQLSWWAHFKEIFTRGIIDTRSLTYFITFIAFFLFLLWLNLVSRGEFSRSGQNKLKKSYVIISGLIALIAGNIFIIAGLALSGWKQILKEIGEGAFFGAAWPLTVSVILAVLALIILRLGRIKRESSAKIIRNGWPVWLAGISALLLLLNINYITLQPVMGYKIYHRWDITDGEVNTMSPQMREAIDMLEEPITFTTFFSESADYDGVPLARRVRDLLSEMSSYSPNIRLHSLDALEDPKDARALGEKMNLPLPELAKLMVADYKGKRMVIQAQNLLRAPDEKELMAGMKRAILQAEEALTLTIRTISDQRVTRIFFTQGHGEASVTKAGRTPESIAAFAQILRREAYEVRQFLLTGSEPVPPGCDTLIIANPQIAFSREAEKVIEDYLERGGRLMVLLPSSTTQKYKLGLDSIFSKAGIARRSDIVIDTKNNYGSQPTQILSLMDESAPFKTGLTQTVVMLPDTSSFRVSEDRAKKNKWMNWPLLRSLGKSTLYDPHTKKSNPGPASVAVAAVHPANGMNGEARLVVVGCPGFASNIYLDLYSNKVFLLQASRWLAGRDYNVSGVARKFIDYNMKINEEGLRLVWWIAVVEMPLLWLIGGLFIWYRRKE